MQKLKNDLKEQFLEPKKDKLVSLLVDFITNKAPRLISDPEDLKVITFEHDHPPFEFSYVGYPDPNIIAQDYWLDQFIVDASESGDENKLAGILFNNNIVEQEDSTWINTDTGEEVEIFEIYNELEEAFFAKCWQDAKRQTNSVYRCFFLHHDVYRGIDADTGKDVDSDDILKILTDEGFEFKILKSPDNIEATTKPWWKFW